VRSLNQQAGRSAGNSGSANNNNIGTTNSAAAQFAGMMDASAIAASASSVDDFSFDDDDLWESVMNGVVDPTNTHTGNNVQPHPLEMQLSMGFATARNRYVAESNRQQRLLEAASRAFSNNIRGQATTTILDPDQLLHCAISNAAFYQPNWADPSIVVGGGSSTATTRSSRSASAAAFTTNSNSVILFSGEKNQIAHVPLGALEGRAIRTEQPFPQVGGNNVTSNLNTFDPFGLSSSLSPTNSHDSDNFDLLCNPEMAMSPQQALSRIFGFRVVFDIPTRTDDDDAIQVGSDLGGCFLIGVTSSSFASFNESSALQRSNLFWGIEDQGQIFEGSNRSDVRGNITSARPSQQQRDGSRRRPYNRLLDGSGEGGNNTTAGATTLSMELGIDDSLSNARETRAIPMNAHSVLFGLREVITVVCDLEHRSLTYWRNETLLGTIVSNIPRSGSLFPVVVPFNAGVTVAISAITMEPLPM
jgi:hypothetical protein